MNLKLDQQKIFLLKYGEEKELKKKNQTFQEIGDNVKGSKLHVIGITEEKENGTKEILEDMMTNILPKLMKKNNQKLRDLQDKYK